jgi:hypothetical protein
MRHDGIHPDTRREERAMKWILAAALALSLNFASAFAQEACESKAVSKYGRPLVGAAKASFINARGTPVKAKQWTETVGG